MAERLAIVGGDAAGMSAAAVARRRDADLEIVAFERSPYTSYSACGIPYFVGGLFDDADRLISRSPDEFRSGGYRRPHALRGHRDRPRSADPEVRAVDGPGERKEGFDQLVYATGAVAVPPPVPGAELCEPVRTVDAAERFKMRVERERPSRRRHRCQLPRARDGGGARPPGRGDDAGGARRPGHALPRPGDGRPCAGRRRGVGVRVLLSTAVEEIRHRDGRPCSVVTSEGELPAAHVVLSTGVRPEARLAEEAGLRLGETGALAVDDHQRCLGADGAFAAGDCVESRHRLLDPRSASSGCSTTWRARLSASAYTHRPRPHDRRGEEPLRPHTCLTVRLPLAPGGELDVEAHTVRPPRLTSAHALLRHGSPLPRSSRHRP